jgi:hypothetical protein
MKKLTRICVNYIILHKIDWKLKEAIKRQKLINSECERIINSRPIDAITLSRGLLVDYNIQLALVKNRPINIKYFKQTNEMIFAAIDNVLFCDNLISVLKEPMSLEVALYFAKRRPPSIQYLQQNEKIVLAALAEDPNAIDYVFDQNDKVVFTALNMDPYTLRFINEQTFERCLFAVKKDWDTRNLIRDSEMYNRVVEEIQSLKQNVKILSS